MPPPRREQQQRSAERRARKQFEQQTQQNIERGQYVPPPRAECHEKTFFVSLDDQYTVRIDHRLWRHHGRTVDFVLLLQVPDWADQWQTIARIDCCHGHCHMHPPDSDAAARSIHRLESVADVEAAYPVATAQFEEYGRRIRDMRGNGDD
jgi:hypothetical protein